MSSMKEVADAFDKLCDVQARVSKEDRVAFDEITERLEQIEARAASPGRTASAVADREHLKRFTDWLRHPHDGARKNLLSDFEHTEAKSMSIASDAGGGYAVPAEIASEIGRLELALSPVRRLVRVMRIGTSDFKALVNIRGGGSGWVGESDTRTETSTPSLRSVVPTAGELYAYPKTTSWALDDIFFDVGAWLAEEAAQLFAQAEGLAVISGDGSNKPTGMLNTTPVATADFASPPRAAAAYHFFPCLTSQSPAVAEVRIEPLVDLVYSVNSAYRANGTFVMNSATAGAVRKLKDTSGRYVWVDSLAAGQPDRLLGYPVAIWEDVGDIATNSFPIGFGDFRRGYLLADRSDLRITVDDNVTSPGFVKFYLRRRVGGNVLDNHAVRWLRTTIA